MTTFCLKPNVFDYAKKYMDKVIEKTNDFSTMEFIITDLLDYMIHEEGFRMKVINTTEKWYGLTYKEDKDILVKEINKLIEKEIYPSKLWNK